MRKVVQYTLMSVDGAVEDPRRYFPESDPTVASAPVFDTVMADLEAEMIGKQDAVLLGRTTFDEWSRYWPTSDEQPFADFINNVKKYVVTSTPLPDAWNNAEAVADPIADVVRDLKARPGGDIGIHASITLAQSLLAAGLVDELHLAVGPVLDSMGRRLFEGLGDLRRLELVRATPTPGGAIWVTYRLP
ncbi:MAG: dihydrofolate reductase family protein [Chloroflexi bacterium]|nr:dihydrofolate reductase family protein [Chloroflexota bacterium]